MNSEESKKLQQETEVYRNNIEHINAEKMAIDKQYVKKLQECILLETNLIKYENEINKLKKRIDDLQKENDSYFEQLKKIKEDKDRMEFGD